MRKFVRRHWLPLAAGAAALLVVLVGAGVIAFEARERAREAERALRETKTTAAVKDFLLGLFAGADPRANAGKQVSVRDLLDKGAEHIDKDLSAQPALQAELKGNARRHLFAPRPVSAGDRAAGAIDRRARRQPAVRKRSRRPTELELATAVRSSGDSRAREDAARRDDRAVRSAAGAAGRETRPRFLSARVRRDQRASFDDALADADRAETIARTHPEQPELLGDALHAKASAQWGVHDYKDAEAELEGGDRISSQARPKYASRSDPTSRRSR